MKPSTATNLVRHTEIRSEAVLVNNRKAELVSQSCIDQDGKNPRDCIRNVQQLKHWMHVTNGLYMCIYICIGIKPVSSY